MTANILCSTAFLTVLAGFSANSLSDIASAAERGPTPPSGDGQRGEELYKASCIICHGPRAAGGIGPRLAGNSVLSNEQAFWKIVHEGRHVMPPLKDALSDQQMADILAWLRSLR